MTKETAEALAPIAEQTAVAKTAAGKVSLFDAFDDLQALIDTEEGGIDEEMRAEFEAALCASREVAAAKTDRCVQFHAALKKQIDFHKEEKERIGQSQKRTENALDRLRGYLLLVCCQFGERKPAKKGSAELGQPTLKGNFGTISTRSGGTAVVIEDAAVIPPRYLTTTVKLSFLQWSSLIDAYVVANGEEARVELLRTVKVENTVDEKAVNAAMEAGNEVPGADLWLKDDTLVVR